MPKKRGLDGSHGGGPSWAQLIPIVGLIALLLAIFAGWQSISRSGDERTGDGPSPRPPALEPSAEPTPERLAVLAQPDFEIEADSTALLAAAEAAGRSSILGEDPHSREAVLKSMIGEQDLGEYRLRLAYDLGMMRLVVLHRGEEPQILTLVDVLPGSYLDRQRLQAGFVATEEVLADHPLEVLGYDQVQVLSTDQILVDGVSVPRATIRWMKVDEDTTEVEAGRGSVIWLRCERAERILLLAGERPGDGYVPSLASAFAQRLTLCNAPGTPQGER